MLLHTEVHSFLLLGYISLCEDIPINLSILLWVDTSVLSHFWLVLTIICKHSYTYVFEGLSVHSSWVYIQG
jgi:hypothetical protein